MVLRILPQHLVRAWQDLGPMLKRAQLPDQPDAYQMVADGRADLWVVLDGNQPIGAVVTQIRDDRLLLWQIGGRRVREWAKPFVGTIALWAIGHNCRALYGVGRKGWKRIVEPLGFERIADIDGMPAWQRRL